MGLYHCLLALLALLTLLGNGFQNLHAAALSVCAACLCQCVLKSLCAFTDAQSDPESSALLDFKGSLADKVRTGRADTSYHADSQNVLQDG